MTTASWLLDTASQLPWSRDALADELSHDADLDVEALYCLHAVFGDDVDKPGWLHTHGLAELGVFDVDVVTPHPEFAAQCGEMLRAISSMVLLGEVADDQDRFVFGKPGGEARFVPAGRFMRDADPTLRRTGLDPQVMSHVHAAAVYLLLALTLGLAVAARRVGTPTLARAVLLLLVLEVAQGVVGFVQYFTDLPEILVGLHMLGAALVSASVTWVVLAVRPRHRG